MTISVAPAPADTFDVAIIGGGPAGIAAAIGIAPEGPSVVVLEHKNLGGQIATSSLIENVFGVGVHGKTGSQLMGAALEQARKFNTHFREMFTAVRIVKDPKTGIFTILSHVHSRVNARCVVLALGSAPRALDVPGVAEYTNRGVVYGSPQYHVPEQWANRNVGIIGGGNSGGQAALFLAKCPGCSVHVFVRGAGLEQDMSRYLVDRFHKANIIVHPHSTLQRVTGKQMLEKAVFKTEAGEEEFPLNFLLIQIGAQPPTGWLEDSGIVMDAKGYILTDRDLPDGLWPAAAEKREPHRFETSMPGVFAIGDAHAKTPNRMSCAVGEGHAAAVEVYKYLEYLHEQQESKESTPHLVVA